MSLFWLLHVLFPRRRRCPPFVCFLQLLTTIVPCVFDSTINMFIVWMNCSHGLACESRWCVLTGVLLCCLRVCLFACVLVCIATNATVWPSQRWAVTFNIPWIPVRMTIVPSALTSFCSELSKFISLRLRLCHLFNARLQTSLRVKLYGCLVRCCCMHRDGPNESSVYHHPGGTFRPSYSELDRFMSKVP